MSGVNGTFECVILVLLLIKISGKNRLKLSPYLIAENPDLLYLQAYCVLCSYEIRRTEFLKVKYLLRLFPPISQNSLFKKIKLNSY